MLWRLSVAGLLAACLAVVAGCKLPYGWGRVVRLECDSFYYEIDRGGRNLAFVDKAEGCDYLDRSGGSYCAVLEREGESYLPSRVELDGSLLRVDFDRGGVVIEVKQRKSYLVFEVVEVTGSADGLTFLNVPLKLEALPEESFATCALSLNLHTRVDKLPALQSELSARCFRRFGFEGARVAVIGVPQAEMLPTIREVMKSSECEIPLSEKGGAWALDSKDGYGSYVMNFGDLTEATVEKWIESCKNLGFNQIQNHGGSPSFFKFGCLELDPKRYPDGWQSFARIVKRLKEAGISSILHTYTCYISPGSHYVTPVPHPDLDILTKFTLVADVGVDDTEIVVRESTADVVLKPDFMDTSNKKLRLGDEIIHFEGVTGEAPYKFTGCKRGFHGTVAASYKAGSSAGLMKTFWNGLYVPRAESELFVELAKRTAEVVNECGFEGVYLDAIEGLQYMWGRENYWYYGDKFVHEMMRHLERPVGLEYAGMIHSWWHYRSRYQAWDMMRRGYKRFMDTRIAAIKSGQEYQHGSWGGYWPDIERFAPQRDCGIHLPLQLGWWRFNTWTTPQSDNMFIDDIEYICCKMLGNNAGFSVTSGGDIAVQERYPVYKEFSALIRQYEELRHAGYFDESVLAQLRQPGREFTLFRGEGERWNFKPVFYSEHKVDGGVRESLAWGVDNRYGEQPLQLRIEGLMGAAEYGDAKRKVVMDSSCVDEFVADGCAEGVELALGVAAERVPATGERAVALQARNSGRVGQAESWGVVVRRLEPGLNLGKNQAMGLWVKGDGSGALVDIRLYTRALYFDERKCSYFVKLDFEGWRYITLIEPESTRLSDYRWPIRSRYFVYDNHGGTVNFGSVDEVQLWVNNLPSGRGVNCLIGPVQALPLVEKPLEKPSVVINGDEVVFPVSIGPGMYLEMFEGRGVRLYGRDSKLVQEVELAGRVPQLRRGMNQIEYRAGSGLAGSRAKVTLKGVGEAL